MADRDVTRRELLRGLRRKPAEPVAPAAPVPITKDGRELPALISWLDPEMRATERRGEAGSSFPLLRPPGAVAEDAFLQACTRCGDCAAACPHDAIHEASERFRGARGTPVITPLRSPCQMCEDLPCITACETGALRPEAPAALGSARVQPLDCLNQLSTSCSVCVERCPVPGAMRFAGNTPVVNEPLCTGCGICQHVCPAPQNAILMLPNAERPTPASLAPAPPDPGEEPPLELAELHEGTLDPAALRALFRDLRALAEIDEIQLKQAAQRRADAGRSSLEDALRALLTGAARGAQIRYRYRGEAWCDTVLATAEGHRVVRMAAPTRPSDIG